MNRSTLPGDAGGTPMSGCRLGDPACRLDAGRSYDKQVFTLGAELAW